ncbi:MAG: PIN domain-containing protein [Candidatus Hydrothermarchaeales archaeon]
MKSLVLDASALIELAYATSLGEKIKNLLEDGGEALTTRLALTELYYVLCRALGAEIAREKLDDLISSNYVVLYDEPLVFEAGKIKCERKISLADCHVIALAMKINGSVLFALKEKELVKENKKRAFEVELVFGEEL